MGESRLWKWKQQLSTIGSPTSVDALAIMTISDSLVKSRWRHNCRRTPKYLHRYDEGWIGNLNCRDKMQKKILISSKSGFFMDAIFSGSGVTRRVFLSCVSDKAGFSTSWFVEFLDFNHIYLHQIWQAMAKPSSMSAEQPTKRGANL